MAGPSETTRVPEPRRGTASGLPAWLGTLTLWVGGALALALVVLLGVAVLPGWWADLVGSVVQGVDGRGIVLGLVLGAVFTLLPLGVAALAMRSGLTVRARVALVVVALLLLLPTVLTLATAAGSSDARHVLAIEAPGLRGATVVGVVVALVLVAALLGARAFTRRRRALATAQELAVALGRERAAAGETTAAAEPQPSAETAPTEDPDRAS